MKLKLLLPFEIGNVPTESESEANDTIMMIFNRPSDDASVEITIEEKTWYGITKAEANEKAMSNLIEKYETYLEAYKDLIEQSTIKANTLTPDFLLQHKFTQHEEHGDTYYSRQIGNNLHLTVCFNGTEAQTGIGLNWRGIGAEIWSQPQDIHEFGLLFMKLAAELF